MSDMTIVALKRITLDLDCREIGFNLKKNNMFYVLFFFSDVGLEIQFSNFSFVVIANFSWKTPDHWLDEVNLSLPCVGQPSTLWGRFVFSFIGGCVWVWV